MFYSAICIILRSCPMIPTCLKDIDTMCCYIYNNKIVCRAMLIIRFFFYMSKLFDEKDSRLCTNPIKLCMFLAQKARCMTGSFCFCCLSSRLSSVFPSLPSITSELAKAQFFTFPKIFLSRGLPSLWLRRRGWLADSRAE